MIDQNTTTALVQTLLEVTIAESRFRRAPTGDAYAERDKLQKAVDLAVDNLTAASLADAVQSWAKAATAEALR